MWILIGLQVALSLVALVLIFVKTANQPRLSKEEKEEDSAWAQRP